MKSLFRHWPQVADTLRSPSKKLFVFDFDGTLSPLVSHPSQAKLGGEVKRRLKALSKKKNVIVGVLSGRALVDVRRKIQLPRLVYSGNHGLEAAGPGWKFQHPKVSGWKKNLRSLMRELKWRVANIPGVFLENKGVTASLHYRNVPAGFVAQAHRAAAALRLLCRARGFKIRAGKKVIEFVPSEKWNKGAMLTWLRRKLSNPLVVYIGDDVTDEDAFRVLGRKGLSIRVKKSADSAAQYFLWRQKDVEKFLKKLTDEKIV